MKNVKLSVLDFGTMSPPSIYAHHVINNLFNYVSNLDKLGYNRFWMSEHYSPEFAWHSPEILLPLLVGSTEKIKIGQAGVLLNYHSAFRIAHNFSILSALFPDRIDLGFAPAGISDEVMQSLTGKKIHPKKQYFGVQVKKVIDFLNGTPLNSDMEDSLILPLQGAAKPNIWLLGISDSSLKLAIDHKANFCLSLFHKGAIFNKQKNVIKQYKEMFYERYSQQTSGLASVICICLENRAKLKKEEAKIATAVQKEGYIIGTPDECQEQLLELAEQMQLDEIVLNISGSSLTNRQITTQLIGENMLQHQRQEEPVNDSVLL